MPKVWGQKQRLFELRHTAVYDWRVAIVVRRHEDSGSLFKGPVSIRLDIGGTLIAPCVATAMPGAQRAIQDIILPRKAS